MVKICPVSERMVNENVTRLNALFTFILSILFIFSGSFWFLFAMVLDFSFRLVSDGRLSPLIKVNSYILEITNIRKIVINAGPKIFAARIGLMLSLLSLIFWILNLNIAALTTTSILCFFSFLESAFGFCVACRIYPYALVLNEIRLTKKANY